MEIGGSMLSSLSLTGSDGIVRTSGNQTIRGVKTFLVNPISATVPVTDSELVNKLYVDSTISGGGFVTLNTAQTITAEKTFTETTFFSGLISGDSNIEITGTGDNRFTTDTFNYMLSNKATTGDGNLIECGFDADNRILVDTGSNIIKSSKTSFDANKLTANGTGGGNYIESATGENKLTTTSGTNRLNSGSTGKTYITVNLSDKLEVTNVLNTISNVANTVSATTGKNTINTTSGSNEIQVATVPKITVTGSLTTLANTAHTINGVTTFDVPPISAVAPTTANQLVNKTYADGKVSKTVADTISAIKTFSVLPESSVVPTTANQLVNKTYADTKATDSLVVHLAGTETITGAKTFQNDNFLVENSVGTDTISVAGTTTTLTNTTNTIISGSTTSFTATTNSITMNSAAGYDFRISNNTKLNFLSSGAFFTDNIIAPSYKVGSILGSKALVSNWVQRNIGSMSLGTDVLLGAEAVTGNTLGMAFPVNVKIMYVKLISTNIATTAAQTMRYAGYKNAVLGIFDNSAVTSTAATAYGQFFTIDVSSFNVTLTPSDYYYHTLGGTVASATSLNWNVYVYYQQI